MSNNRSHIIFIESQHISPKLKEFFEAVYKNDLNKTNHLANQNPEFINTVVKHLHYSALSKAILKKNINYPILQLLLKNNINLNTPIGIEKLTSLENCL